MKKISHSQNRNADRSNDAQKRTRHHEWSGRRVRTRQGLQDDYALLWQPILNQACFVYQSALIGVKCAHFSGKSSRAKIAVTGQTGTHAPQSMHSTGLMYSCGSASNAAHLSAGGCNRRGKHPRTRYPWFLHRAQQLRTPSRLSFEGYLVPNHYKNRSNSESPKSKRTVYITKPVTAQAAFFSTKV